jgi:hypothetical protein
MLEGAHHPLLCLEQTHDRSLAKYWTAWVGSFRDNYLELALQYPQYDTSIIPSV